MRQCHPTPQTLFVLLHCGPLCLALSLAGCPSQPDRSVNETDADLSAPHPEPPSESSPTGTARLRTVYVPAYSHLAAPDGRKHLLSVLLSVRNMDSSAAITLTHVDYFDTSGHRVRRYLAAPRRLRPLETAEFKVANLDDVGGSGANFLVYWQGPSDAHPLLTETVMWAHVGSGYISFASRGVELQRRPDPNAFMVESPETPPPTPETTPRAETPEQLPSARETPAGEEATTRQERAFP